MLEQIFNPRLAIAGLLCLSSVLAEPCVATATPKQAVEPLAAAQPLEIEKSESGAVPQQVDRVVQPAVNAIAAVDSVELSVSQKASDLQLETQMPETAQLFNLPPTQVPQNLAQAAETSMPESLAPKNGVYVTLYGVPLQGRKSAEDFIGRATFSTGGGVGGAVGYRYQNFRVDAEISAFKNYFDTLTFFQTGTRTPVPGPSERSPGSYVEGRALMLNLYYDFALNERFKPYIGAGVGFYNAYINNLSPPSFGGFVANGYSADRFAYQLRAGVSYVVSKNADLFAGYRFFKGNQFEYNIAGFPQNPLQPNGLESHSLEVGLKYFF